VADPLSVVVPTRDRPGFLRRLVESLRADLRPADEVLVVDSASRRSPPELAGVRVLTAPRPGASLARNIGWRAAAHPFVAFVDDDCQVAPGWADALRSALSAADFVLGRTDVPAEQAGREHPLGVRLDLAAAPVDRDSAGTLGGSNNFAARVAALAAVGGFDERLGPGTWLAAAEDLDLLDRLLLAGYRGRYEPAALVRHEQWRDRGGVLRVEWAYGKGQGARLSRLRRTDRERAARIAREALWEKGARLAVGELRRGHEFEAAVTLARTAATIAGFCVGRLRLPAR
jgi:glycosyltransferase involved in cell wall biosynthesis